MAEETVDKAKEPEVAVQPAQERVLRIVTDGTKVSVTEQTMTNLEAIQVCQMMLQHVQQVINRAGQPQPKPEVPPAS